jgi:hypothetical protein
VGPALPKKNGPGIDPVAPPMELKNFFLFILLNITLG